MSKTFKTYRYTHIPGDFTNNFPRLAWLFEVDNEKNTISYAVTRCSEKDNFSYAKAKELLNLREKTTIEYMRCMDLVVNAIKDLETKEDHFSQMVLETYAMIKWLESCTYKNLEL